MDNLEDYQAKLEANKLTVRKMFASLDSQDRDAFMEVMHPDHRLEFTGLDKIVDREGHWQMALGHHTAFSDMKHSPDFQVAEGNTVVTRGTITGTNDGPNLGRPATGRSISIQFINISRIVDGKICGMFSLFDNDAQRKQLYD